MAALVSFSSKTYSNTYSMVHAATISLLLQPTYLLDRLEGNTTADNRLIEAIANDNIQQVTNAIIYYGARFTRIGFTANSEKNYQYLLIQAPNDHIGAIAIAVLQLFPKEERLRMYTRLLYEHPNAFRIQLCRLAAYATCDVNKLCPIKVSELITSTQKELFLKDLISMDQESEEWLNTPLARLGEVMSFSPESIHDFTNNLVEKHEVVFLEERSSITMMLSLRECVSARNRGTGIKYRHEIMDIIQKVCDYQGCINSLEKWVNLSDEKIQCFEARDDEGRLQGGASVNHDNNFMILERLTTAMGNLDPRIILKSSKKRCKGVGTALFAEVLCQNIKNHGRAGIQFYYNELAQQFYKKMGCEVASGGGTFLQNSRILQFLTTRAGGALPASY